MCIRDSRYVVNELADKGAIFVHEIDDVPNGQRVIYSAHGVSPAVRDRSKGRGLRVIDATCPLVTKVHIEAVKFAKQGYSLVLIGHRDHDEIEGTLGEAPEVTQVVSNVAEVAELKVPDPKDVYKRQMLKAAIAHKGTVMLDVISPCVTFNLSLIHI